MALSPYPDPHTAQAPRELSGWLVALMATASGFVVANLYYAQPLLHEIALHFGVGSSEAATVVTTTQIGYAVGLVFLVPLGDLFRRRSLVPVLFVAATLCLVVCAVAPSLWLFEVGTIVVGATSIGGQVMIPFAAQLAPDAKRGRVVARMMTGLLLGILLARTVSGSLAELVGWRAIYWLSAILMLVFAVILRRTLPGELERPRHGYLRLVRSSFQFLATEPLLRYRAFLGACSFAAFSLMWTALTFLLSGPPYNLSSGAIGLFGLVGVVGVLSANLAGRLADAERATLVTVSTIVLTLISFGLLSFGSTILAGLLVGIVLLDVATQGIMITNQAVIYGLHPDARSRINSAYMFSYFLGGAIGSATAGIVFSRAGWDGVCVLGGGFALLMLVASQYERVRLGRARVLALVAAR